MESKKLNIVRNVPIARDHWDVPLRVGLVPYVYFCEQLDAQLDELMERWGHKSEPSWHASRKPK